MPKEADDDYSWGYELDIRLPSLAKTSRRVTVNVRRRRRYKFHARCGDWYVWYSAEPVDSRWEEISIKVNEFWGQEP